jgi:hypothetical protein
VGEAQNSKREAEFQLRSLHLEWIEFETESQRYPNGTWRHVLGSVDHERRATPE